MAKVQGRLKPGNDGNDHRDNMQNQPGRPTAAEIARRKSYVLAIATELFVMQGYADTSLAQIARKAGVATRTLYHHFGDKEDLFREVISARTSNPLSERLEIAGSENLFEILMGAARYVTDSAIQERAVDLMRLILAESRRFPELTRKVSDAALSHLQRNVTVIFTDIVASERAVDDDPSLSARLFIDLVLGYAPLRHYASWERELPSDDELAVKVRFFIAGRYPADH